MKFPSGKKEIGRIKLARDYNNIFLTHSSLDRKYHNKGLGVYLYSIAADLASINQIRLHSTTHPSDAAKRVWKSKRFRKYYTVTKRKLYFSVRPKKTLKLINNNAQSKRN